MQQEGPLLICSWVVFTEAYSLIKWSPEVPRVDVLGPLNTTGLPRVLPMESKVYDEHT